MSKNMKACFCHDIYKKKVIVTSFYNSDIFLTIVTVSKFALFSELQVYISQFRLYMRDKKSQLPFFIYFLSFYTNESFMQIQEKNI